MAMELLAPAGHWEAMVAAVQNGADAVYMGFGDYNARRGARNFSEEEFLAAISYCHLRGVRVYLTLNTLLSDRELPAAAKILRTVSDAGVDGVIVQDWGVAALARAIVPDLPLHGSTQMSVHTLSGVEELASMGVTCAVLARELSRDQAAEICRRSPIDIEVFGHGALCMCYSGQCAMSALIGERSGNRGTCAQPCRLPYTMEGGGNPYPLSLKDAALAPYIPELLDMGVASLKLEGRMKRPEYVAVITGIYRRLIDEYRPATPQEMETLARVFSRSGFTDGYWTHHRGPKMFGVRAKGAEDPADLFAAAKAAYLREEGKKIPLSLTLTLKRDVPVSLTAADSDGHVITVTGEVPQEARNRPLTLEDAAARLSKTGGTTFSVQSVEGTAEPGLILSAASLNGLRRSALEAMEKERTAPPQRRSLPDPAPVQGTDHSGAPAFTLSLMTPAQLSPALMAEGPAVVSLPLHRVEEVDLTPYLGSDTVFSLELPRIWRDEDVPALRRLMAVGREKGFTALQLHNIGHLPLVRETDYRLRGDYGLNIFNAKAVEFLRERGLESATLSFELRHQQIRDMEKPLACEAIIYGRLPLMITENCLVFNRFGCKAKNLHGPCTAYPRLVDRRKEAFPVCPVFGCRSEIQNGRVLWLADRPEWKDIGLAFARLRFTIEDAAECAALFRAVRAGETPPPDHTRGLFYRGVE